MTPDGWFQTTLEQVADIAIGRTPARDEKSNWDPGKTTQNRWATIANIKEGKFIGETTEYISDLGVQHSNAQLVPPGTLLMSFKLSLGAGCDYIDADVYERSDSRVLRPNGLANTEYLYYLLPTLALEESSDRAVKGQTLNKAKLRALQLVLPPADEQRKIAAILSSVDNAIDKTQAVIDQVQVVKRGLMQELFTRGLPGRHTRFKQTEIGRIPEEWQLKQLIEVASVQTGLAKNKNNAGPVTVPYLRVANVQDGFLSLTEMKSVEVNEDALSRYALMCGDVLFTEGGDADKLGRGAVWNGEIELCLHQNHIFVARPLGNIRPMFLSLYGGSSRGKSYFVSYSKQTTNLASMNSTQLKHLPVPVPRLEEQDQILEHVGAFDGRLKHEEGCLSALGDLKAALMSVLLTGELRVTPYPETA